LLQSGLFTKEQVEHASKYINQPGVYATFKTVEDEEEEEVIYVSYYKDGTS